LHGWPASEANTADQHGYARIRGKKKSAANEHETGMKILPDIAVSNSVSVVGFPRSARDGTKKPANHGGLSQILKNYFTAATRALRRDL
jgi:hypothetical protein